MLAFAVREALRAAAAAFAPDGGAGTSVDLASPATPEAVFWAVEDARSGDPDRARLVRGGHGVVPDQPGPGEPLLHPHSEQVQRDLLAHEPGSDGSRTAPVEA